MSEDIDNVHLKLALIKKGRKGGPHSKSGCATCRKRHIKCDESRPACFRCTSTGRQCDYGYLDRSSRSRSNTPDDIKLSERCSSAPPVGSTIGLLPQGHKDDFRYIQFFHVRSAPALLGFYEGDSPFWSKLLLQASFNDAAVRHAVVAVGFTFEVHERARAERGSSSPSKPGQGASQVESFKSYLENRPCERDFILRQYNHAIRSLTQRDPGNRPSREVVLITCLLFICLEFMRENFEGALMHLSSGLQMLREDKRSSLPGLEPELLPQLALTDSSSSSESSTPPTRTTELDATLRPPSITLSRSVSPSIQDSHEVNTMMLPLFSRLSCLASFFGKPMFDKVTSKNDLLNLSIPASFSSLKDAHNTMTVILTCTFGFYRECTPSRYARAVSPSSAFFPSSRLSNTQSRSAEATKELLEARLKAWSASFAAFLTTNITNLSSSSLRTVSFLKLLKHTLNLFTGTCFSPYELAYDALLADFKAIVSHATDLVDAKISDDESPESNVGAAFSFEMGIVPNLYWTAIKCRHHIIRWRAIHLLRRCRRREGLWDSDIDARVATKVVELEEKDVDFEDLGEEHYDKTMAVVVPEAKRVYDAAIQKQATAPLGDHPVHISTRPAGPGTSFVTQSYLV